MYFHEIASELKTYMAPKSRDGEFVILLVRLSIRPPMNDEEQEADYLHEYNPMQKTYPSTCWTRYLREEINIFQRPARA